jgi:hypothetical protein
VARSSSTRRKKPSGKTLRSQAITGQRGANFIERIVLEMGCTWTPIPGALDAGIDGHIELRDPHTGAMLNSLVRVQSKATVVGFHGETPERLEYTCDERDLGYWLSGNTPVVLVVSRPGTDEAYWVSVKDYFRDPARRQVRKVCFDKSRDRFDVSCREALFRLALPRDAGLYVSPPPIRERLFSNLLQVTTLPARLYAADTPFGARRRVDETVQAAGGPARAWEYVLRGKRILCIYDLTTPAWSKVVDRGTVEEFDTEEWASSDDPEQFGDFVELIHRCLGARLRALDLGIRFNPDEEYFFFGATEELEPLTVRYKSMSRDSGRKVFQKYSTKKSGEAVREFYRHNAFHGRFRRYDGAWFLEITPTYRFTSDGRNVLKYAESKLKGMKALEKNATVLGQVVMWADLLRGRHEQGDLFRKSGDYLHIGFGDLETFSLDAGINETAWLATEEAAEAAQTEESRVDLPLLSDEPNPYAGPEGR